MAEKTASSTFNKIAALRQLLAQQSGTKYMDYAKEKSIDLNLIGSLGKSPSKTPINYTPTSPIINPDYVIKGYILYGYVL